MANGTTLDFSAFDRTKRVGKPPQNITVRVISFDTSDPDPLKHTARCVNNLTNEEMRIALRPDPEAGTPQRKKPRPAILDFAGVSGPHVKKVSVQEGGIMRFDNVWPVDRVSGLYTSSWANTISRAPGLRVGLTAFARINSPRLPDPVQDTAARATVDVLQPDKEDRSRVMSTPVTSKAELLAALSVAIDGQGKKAGNSAALVRFVGTVDGETKTGDLFVPPMSAKEGENYKPLKAEQRWAALNEYAGTGPKVKLFEAILADPNAYGATIEVIPATRLPVIGDTLIGLVESGRLENFDKAYKAEANGHTVNCFALSEVGFMGSDPDNLKESELLFYTHCERRGYEFPLFQPGNVPSAAFDGIPEIRAAREKAAPAHDDAGPALG